MESRPTGHPWGSTHVKIPDMALSAFRRRAAALAGLLVLALVAGPAASAACAHLVAPAGMEAEMGHGPMAHGSSHHEAPPEPAPCHDDGTEEAPPVTHTCASVCCTTDAPTPVPPAPAVASTDVPAPLVVDTLALEAEAPDVDVPPTPSPPRPTRLHVEIGRFLI